MHNYNFKSRNVTTQLKTFAGGLTVTETFHCSVINLKMCFKRISKGFVSFRMFSRIEMQKRTYIHKWSKNVKYFEFIASTAKPNLLLLFFTSVQDFRFGVGVHQCCSYCSSFAVFNVGEPSWRSVLRKGLQRSEVCVIAGAADRTRPSVPDLASVRLFFHSLAQHLPRTLFLYQTFLFTKAFG